MQSAKPVKLNDTQIKRWMLILIERAKKVGAQGEVPVAAVILNEKGQCIGHGRNSRNKCFDPLGHAEVIALRQAAWVKGDWRFNECTLIVTLEPCQMCSGAIIQARMGSVIFGASDQKRGGLGGSLDMASHKSAHHKMSVRSGVLTYEIKKVMENWFSEKRLNKTRT